jgi:hypothetical protein
VGQDVLFGKPHGGDGLQACEKILIAGVLDTDCLEGVFLQPVVIAIIPIGGRALRVGFEVGLVQLFKQRVLSGHARIDRNALRCQRCACGNEAARGGDNRKQPATHSAKG